MQAYKHPQSNEEIVVRRKATDSELRLTLHAQRTSSMTGERELLHMGIAVASKARMLHLPWAFVEPEILASGLSARSGG